MLNPAKKFSPALFGVILICFFLPFINLSCQSQKLATFTGVQMATGTTIEEASFLEQETKQQKIPADPLVSIAFVSAFVGLGTSFLKSKKSAIIPAGTGAFGSILLLFCKTKIDNEVLRQGKGILQVEYGIGFWLSFLLFLAAAVLNALIFFQNRNSVKNYTDR